MLKANLVPAILLLLCACGQPSARAAGPWQLFDGCHWSMPRLCAQWQQRRCWCPDDYCKKLLPGVSPQCLGPCDDYCRKPLPLPPHPTKGCVDDYCPKTCPLYLGPNCEPWYRCGPPACPQP